MYFGCEILVPGTEGFTLPGTGPYVASLVNELLQYKYNVSRSK